MTTSVAFEMSIKNNYETVLNELVLACQRARRNPADVRLVVVTKTHPLEAVRAVIDAGARLLGENYADEALPKIAAIGPVPGLAWHMIGHVQSRKADDVAPHFALMHSLDSIKLAGRLSRAAGEAGCILPVLIQLNVSGEESKFGYPAFNEAQLPALFAEIEQILAFPNISVRGLMTMPPYSDDPETSRPFFQRLSRIRETLAKRFPQTGWDELSMGMSGDYTVAVEEGATLVRVGTAIMGTREYLK